MKNNFIFFIFIIFFYSCHHIDDTKYEKIYFHDFKKDLIESTQSEIVNSKEKNETSESTIHNVTLETKENISNTGTVSKKIKKKGKIKIGELTIESDTMTFNKVTSEAVFQGNVKLKSEGVNLFCDKLQSLNYRDSAEAIGNVMVNYPQQKVKITCKKIKYDKAISIIEGYENVHAEKILNNNEKINLYADKIKYDVATGEIFAEKVNKKVKIKLKDIVAFSDRVVYNEAADRIELTGTPFAKKQESVFISDNIYIDINKMQIKLKKNIWARLFYSDFENIKKEISLEKDNY